MTKKTIFSFLLFSFAFTALNAQKYYTRNGKVSFYSDAPLEKIEAKNDNANSVIDSESGKMEFAVLIKAFQFEKSLMQEHFNENYMESDKYPKAIFKGQIADPYNMNFKKDGEYPVRIKGQMTIHGVTKDIETTGVFKVVKGKISASSQFSVLVADYNIEIPAVVRDNIAKEVKIKVELEYQELK